MLTMLLAVALSAGAVDATSVAPPTPQDVTLVAVAPDAHACVLRSVDGTITRYAEGAAPAPAWRVSRVAADGVTLTSTQRLGGQGVEILLRVNESIDLAAESAAIAALGAPKAEPLHTQLIPQKRKPAANR